MVSAQQHYTDEARKAETVRLSAVICLSMYLSAYLGVEEFSRPSWVLIMAPPRNHRHDSKCLKTQEKESTDHVSSAGMTGSALLRSADRPAIIGMLFWSFFFRLFLSSVLIPIAAHIQSLNPSRSFLPLKSNCSSLSRLLLRRLAEPVI